VFKDKYYRPDEVAEILGINIVTVYRHIKDLSDPMPAVRLKNERCLRISGTELNKWLDRRRVNPDEI
jgi:predicted DNA-binding transcriptional regulator AlpA